MAGRKQKEEKMNAKEISECVVDQIQNLDENFIGDVAKGVQKRFERLINELIKDTERKSFEAGWKACDSHHDVDGGSSQLKEDFNQWNNQVEDKG